MENLLEKIGIIDFKYEKLRHQNNFNIFSILKSKTDEVHLHSRFIAELLNPKGTHKQGVVFLEAFLKLIECSDFPAQGTTVLNEYRKIDLLIRNGKKAIIIENKIWAGDQKDQLYRYYQTMLAEGATEIKLIYLTLEGREPSNYSLGPLQGNQELDKFLTLLSYDTDINKWLDNCIKEVALVPVIRETLVQYKGIINDLTGNAMSNDEMLEIIKLLSSNDNILKAAKIARNWVHVKWYTEWDFWNDLEKEIAAECTILPYHKFNGDKLDGAIHKRRNKNFWYGITIELIKNNSESVCLMIERGDRTLYYGLIILEDGKDRKDCNAPEYAALRNQIKPNSDDTNKNWLGYKYFSIPINFERFKDDTTLKLANPDFRKKYVASLWTEIKAYIKNCGIREMKLQETETNLLI
ncbi:PDDEXK-like family protein [Adhaeribacter soli]|uniref:PD-(D/E)XK nuclease family protein n=1 Tax=Adhaeribacter soli TaxID=2607655 RepID=A0A5N1IMM0_9BACT|nr:PD-(D/E)XK nuclease family protein [Adhaeribacter soli]KAA9325167.1 hypothetical protein F0P94_18220 [Adhaeribacter soli]